MEAKLCRHLKENGIFCQSAALRGRNYCYFHLRLRGRRMAMAKSRARGQRCSLHLPPLENMFAVQVAIMQVLDAIAADRIDNRRAGLLLYGLQQASANLQAYGAWTSKSNYEIDSEMDPEINPEAESIALDYPEFEQEFSLPKRLDLDLPPEQAFPSPRAAEDVPRSSPATATKSVRHNAAGSGQNSGGKIAKPRVPASDLPLVRAAAHPTAAPRNSELSPTAKKKPRSAPLAPDTRTLSEARR